MGKLSVKWGMKDLKKWEDPKMENLSKACQKKKKKMKSFIEFHNSICRVYFRDKISTPKDGFQSLKTSLKIQAFYMFQFLSLFVPNHLYHQYRRSTKQNQLTVFLVQSKIITLWCCNFGTKKDYNVRVITITIQKLF